MKTLTLSTFSLATLLFSGVGAADTEVDLFTGEGVALGGVLFPHLHIAGVAGASTANEISSLSGGHHDPQSDVTLQALEPGLSLRAGMLEGFATYSVSTDADGVLDGELEEAFLKLIDLPGGFEIRGGRFLNRFGFQNAQHSHAWDQVNNTLLNGRILQEGEIITDGGELTWNLPTTSTFRSALSFSYGQAPAHSEEHEEEGEEPEFEGEGARFIDDFYTASYTAAITPDDFHTHRFVLSAAWGDNEFARRTQLYGLGYEYGWRENGLELGGRSLRWRTEVAYRRFGAVSGEHGHGDEEEEEHHDEEEEGEHHDEEEEEEESRMATLDDFGIYSTVLYGFNEHIEAGVRVGYVPSVSEAGLEERWRISPSLTISANQQRTLFTRLQYDYDNFGSGDEHSVFLQVGFNWGGREVR